MSSDERNDVSPRAEAEPSAGAESRELSRRSFMGVASKLAVGAAVAGAATHAAEGSAQAKPQAANVRHSPLEEELVQQTFQVRSELAASNAEIPIPRHVNNGDEQRYPNKIGSDTRGLPHDSFGEVDLDAWASLIHALDTQDNADFERVTLGGTRKLAHPLGALALNLTGIAAPQHVIPPAPALASAERAADAIEAYWQALLRDVPFHEYRSDTGHPLVLAAAAEINGLSGYTGPRDPSGRVTPELLFRGTARYLDTTDRSGRRARHAVPPGVLEGPYISQFVLKDIPYAVQSISAQLRVPVGAASNDFSTNYDEWLAIQDGRPVSRSLTFDSARRLLSTGRDLAEYAHGGAPAFWGASQLLGTAVAQGGLGAPLHPNNPYLTLTKTASGISTFGFGAVQAYLPLGSSREIRANYWQKWFVQRTLRPEAYGGLVHNYFVHGKDYPLHADILASEAVDRVFRRNGTYLLPGAYPEGAPNHSSYPGGASSIGAINATFLKAFFDESFVIPDPLQPDPRDPTRLIPYAGPPLTVGGELNKLATNLGQGRNWAGIHFRSDAAASLPQAEEVAIAILRDEKRTFKEPFRGFELTRFDGSIVRI
ncbi:MAG: hypothetical protein RL033_5006 [Pseudomonadota bacterium]